MEQTFYCDRLGRETTLSVDYQQNDDGSKILVVHGCQDCQNCGIGTQDANGNWDFDWSQCMAP